MHSSVNCEKCETERPSYEVADVFRKGFNEFYRKHKVSLKQISTAFLIMNCRTSKLGGHHYKCDDCGYEDISYNSCRNRHCPKCQQGKKYKWVADRLKELLPVPYYHVVFTLPHEFNDLILYNKRLLYNLFFKSISDTIDKFSISEKYLGAHTGYISILHTWGQKMGQHIHMHIIIAGGGLTRDNRWKTLPYKSRFLFPVRAVTKVFRGKYIEGLKRLYYSDKLIIPDSMEDIKSGHIFEEFLNNVCHKNWRMFTKKPFAGPEEVLKYIARYTHRVAISNYRILEVENGRVIFKYKDYKGHAKGGELYRRLNISYSEFIRRFFLHILPDRFKKIRFYGFWTGSQKRKTIPLIRSILGFKDIEFSESYKEEQKEYQLAETQIYNNIRVCPRCKSKSYRLTGNLLKDGRKEILNSS